MEQNKKPETLTLTLPLVDFTGTDKSLNRTDSYSSDGVFFVHDKDGGYSIAQVNKEENYVWINPMPTSVCVDFFKKTIEVEQADEFKQLSCQLSELRGYLSEKLGVMEKSMEEKLNHVRCTTRSIEDNIGMLATIEDHLSSIRSESEHPKGGYVDQDTLLQIIKEVKR